ncbi:hypothetical protein GCM10009548_50030 [Streptomyces malaysiensis subsp. malaysiensis]|uniref:Cytochrome P450 n=1 Tax=Streptomyces malaysiensis TaxID=92644 RepID=A0ABX6WIB2_STRMQ|nr:MULTISPECIES: cytochrome P450 [Streptomyces]QPI61089.1 cytochrome P450 [Streptomyces solisilvae]UHH22844.1 cytochrome P450 [Streptomyces sp. HNM0561]
MTDAAVSLRDLMSPASIAHPYPLYERMHRRGEPVVEDPSGVHLVSGYAECHALLRDARCSSDETGSTMFHRMRGRGELSGEDAALLAKAPFMLLDPPAHTRLRRLAHTCLIPAFAGLPERIERIVAELLDAAGEREFMDVVADFAFPLPVRIICELLGLPQEDFPRLGRWSGAMARNMDQAFNLDAAARAEGTRARASILDYFHELIPARRAAPSGDVISQLVALADQGAADTEEVASICALLLVAGHETTVNLIANGVLLLLGDPRLRRRVADRPGAAKAMVEEVLRFDPPLHFRTRVALSDIEIAGRVVPRGATLVLLLAAANRDPRRFDSPDVFDLDRRNNRHLGFGLGLHACLGAALARSEGEIALREFARRVRGAERLEARLTYRPTLAMRGPARLPIRYTSVGPGRAGTDSFTPHERTHEMHTTTTTELTEDKLGLLMQGHVAFQALWAGHELGLFGHLSAHPDTPVEETAKALGIEPDPMEVLLGALRGVGLVEVHDGRLRNAPLAEARLVPGKPGSFVPMLGWQHHIVYPGMRDFTAALRSGSSVGLRHFPGPGETLYERLAGHPDLRAVFQDAMSGLSSLANEALGTCGALRGLHHVADIGGGDGTNAIALVRSHPGLSVTVFDLPSVTEMAEENIARAGLRDRVRTHSGDMFSDPFPEDLDGVLFSHLLNIFTPETSVGLLRKAYDCLPEGGKVAVLNMMQNDAKDGPATTMLAAPYFLTIASGQGRLYSWAEYESWIREAGFGGYERFTDLPFFHGLHVGTR